MASIFSRSKQKIKLAWEFDGETLIWRIFFAPENKIVGETRDQEAKATRYFCVDAESGKPKWSGVELDEPWWIGIETVLDSWIILHGYTRPDMPEHRGLWVADVETGKTVWKNDSLAFWFLQNGKLYAHKYLYENRIGYELDIKTGEIIKEYSGDLNVLHELKRNSMEVESQTGVTYPELFDKTQKETQIGELVEMLTGGQAIEGWIEFILHKDILVLSYYQKETVAGKVLLNNILIIYNLKNESILYNDIIMKGVAVPSPDTFFIKNEMVYFIKNQTILTAISPWKS